ncbi:chemoreceptor glutamine deamidase CheD [Nitrosospira briensis]|uniref:chemoreceptor glutamine deamidase CheD n=1 Tax=Nitrosospira briensis TaxID=35799 RepID=UPI000469696D|nr:chemoreceptor glutamine deamidase CheD [Nitrosospira briensis]
MDERSNAALATHLYFDRKYETEAARVLPGEYYATDQNMLLATVLGSCVTACIRDRQNGIGGMNHFMLPDGRIDENDPSSMSARYGIYAMEILINHIIKIGARRANLEAKVFGGGNVMPGLIEANVGERNAEFVLGFLETENIPIVARDLVDIYPRKVHYFPSTGKVLVKKLRDLPDSAIIEREKNYSLRLPKASIGGVIELFS